MSYAVLLSSILALAPGAERKLVDRIVAVVNDEIITFAELETATKLYMEEGASEEKKKATMAGFLDQMISDKLVSQQVTEAKISAGDEEVDRAIKDILRQNNITDAELRQAVESRGMSFGQYREDLKQQLIRLKIIDLKVRSRVQISDQEVKNEYDRLATTEAREEMISLRHIFFRWSDAANPAERTRVLTAANEARDRVKKGEDFAAVAKSLSEGPTASNGGDLGEVTTKGLLPELAKAIQGLPNGEVSAPVETKNGVHLVRVDARRTKAADGFAEKRQEIYQRLYTAEVDRQMKLWVEELKASAAIDVRL